MNPNEWYSETHKIMGLRHTHCVLLNLSSIDVTVRSVTISEHTWGQLVERHEPRHVMLVRQALPHFRSYHYSVSMNQLETVLLCLTKALVQGAAQAEKAKVQPRTQSCIRDVIHAVKARRAAH